MTATLAIASAINDRGAAAVMFARCRDTCTHRSIWVTVRRAGSAFARPVRLTRDTSGTSGAVAVAHDGSVLAAWEQTPRGASRGAIVATSISRGAIAGKTRLLGVTSRRPTVTAAVLGSGRRVVAWFSESVGEAGYGGPAIVRAAAARPGGRFSTTILDRFATPLSEGAAPGLARLRMAADGDDRALLVWVGHANDYVVRTAQFPGRASAARTISPPGRAALVTDLSTDSTGRAVVTWAEHTGPTPQTTLAGVGAAVRPTRASAFGAPSLPFTGAFERAAALARDGSPAKVVAGGPFAGGSTTPLELSELIGQ
jgi:hypothetical protein